MTSIHFRTKNFFSDERICSHWGLRLRSEALRLRSTHSTSSREQEKSTRIFLAPGSDSRLLAFASHLRLADLGTLAAMAAAVMSAGALSAAGRSVETLACAASGSSIATTGKASFFAGGASGRKLVALRSGNVAGRRGAVVVRASEGNSTTTTSTPAAEASEVEVEVPIEKRFPAFPTALDINQIMDILPHRFPFLLVDRVIEYNPGESAVAIKNVTINDNFFPGHFPQRPIMPGVLMVEAMAQVGGIVMLQPDVGGSKESFFFAGVDKVRFRKPVIAGDTLLMKMKLTKLNKRFGIAKMEGQAYVGGELVCEGEFMMALGKAE
ncbi:hypothetical protein M758_3G223500 [Ceratodon purpureus]|uniref:3-hydroxyacyl-[acyl-carrier-protein] dehydratase n=1 Tax=Ceratodon purpureus TaxID=3225 RepID=A0A8T0INP0_CERPU|nr:hypothetical protein KC19_3G222000 [Ceratodon purpureus]KAG0624092.1 hypothetical protein M758_3G223500 [Ceratodon purpureus]